MLKISSDEIKFLSFFHLQPTEEELLIQMNWSARLISEIVQLFYKVIMHQLAVSTNFLPNFYL